MTRPPSQRWIKRPPRPSRGSRHHAAPPPRPKPTALHLGAAVGAGFLASGLAATLAISLGAREGVPGLVAGLGMFGGGLLTWRAFGHSIQDLRDFFR